MYNKIIALKERQHMAEVCLAAMVFPNLLVYKIVG